MLNKHFLYLIFLLSGSTYKSFPQWLISSFQFFFFTFVMFKFEGINISFSNSLVFTLVNNFFFFKSFTIITTFVYLFIAFGNWFDFKYSSPSFLDFWINIFLFLYIRLLICLLILLCLILELKFLFLELIYYFFHYYIIIFFQFLVF